MTQQETEMGIRLKNLLTATVLTVAFPFLAEAGKYGFADKTGGGKNDPIIEVSATTAPNVGSRFSVTEDEANAAYGFAAGTYTVTSIPQLIPATANGAAHAIRIRFPFKISNKKVMKTIMKKKASLASTSFLTPNVSILDENGLHVPGIATVKGKDVFGTKLSNDPNFPTWLENGKNTLVASNVLAYIADEGDQNLSMPAAFGGTSGTPGTSTIEEIRIKIDKIDGVIINGHWVLKIDDGTSMGIPASTATPVIDDVVPTSPVSPPKMVNGVPVVETFSNYRVLFSEPMVPWSVGFGAASVNDFNASGAAVLPLIYNGNSGLLPNPLDLAHPYFPNMRVTANPAGTTTYVVPFDVRPINPNNLSEYLLKPILDLPGQVPVNISGLAASINGNPSPAGGTIVSAPTSIYGSMFNDATATATRSFQTNKGPAFVNAPVSPGALYYAPVSGSGIGAINLDGNGLETNAPSTSKTVILTSPNVICACPNLYPLLAGSHLNGCNGNTFGDFTGANPVGVAGNTNHLGPSTPVPGVNEGSVGSTANGNNPFGIFPEGFETVVKDSQGNARLAGSPDVGGITDIQIGEFLDTLFFDTVSSGVPQAAHMSFQLGTATSRNTISDPPAPNPPPLRVAVGLPAVDIVFNQQKLLQPAFVIEGDESWSASAVGGCAPMQPGRVLLLPNPISPSLGDQLPAYAQNGPDWQTFGTIAAYASRQQIGNFLYVADRDNGGVTVLNSNTFSVLDRIEVPDANGLGMGVDLRRLYVSNFGNDTVSIIDTDPLSGSFHSEINRVKVGSGPRAVSVQPDNEDVLVGNWVGNTVSILDIATQTIRKTVAGPFSRPFEIIATPRQILTGWTNAVYMGYIASDGTDDVVIYESGPTGTTGFGADAIRWGVNSDSRFEDMRGMAFDNGIYPGSVSGLSGGIFLTHRDEDTGLAMLSRIVFTAQLPGPGAFPPVALPGSILNSPGVVQRIFTVVGFWGGPLVPMTNQLNPGGQDQTARDVAFADVTVSDFHSRQAPMTGYKTNVGAFPAVPVTGAGSTNSKHPYRISMGAIFPTYVTDRVYVSYPGSNFVAVIDPAVGGQVLNGIPNVPSVGIFANYFDQ